MGIHRALNFKGILYEPVKLSFPGMKPKCEELLDMAAPCADDTVPIIEFLGVNYKALNDLPAILNLFNARFTQNDGFRDLPGVGRSCAAECDRNDITELKGGEEAKVLEGLGSNREPLKQHMASEDDTEEPTYIDFRDAGMVKRIETSSAEKYKVLMDLYGDDIITELMQNVDK
ncbi:hypothetical protein BJ878DRAFT_481568 [Calycina marina]|uniref:Uncharacterized protein n=1 Tax=Calycina marina TaxID=1763456 RepID=A0A9P7YZN7_9HELO|nr:hypothetical protein BJ878DRAFT_481568 [Calycina marina]